MCSLTRFCLCLLRFLSLKHNDHLNRSISKSPYYEWSEVFNYSNKEKDFFLLTQIVVEDEKATSSKWFFSPLTPHLITLTMCLTQKMRWKTWTCVVGYIVDICSMIDPPVNQQNIWILGTAHFSDLSTSFEPWRKKSQNFAVK